MTRFRPVTFERLAAAFDADAARKSLCESSGSEHLAESLTDLSDLVTSFMERGDRDEEHKHDLELDRSEKYEWSDSEKKDKLLSFLEKNEDEVEDDWDVKEKIRTEVEAAYGLDGDRSSHGFKRRLMTHLRDRGFDAGLCKSKWEKIGKFPAGDYEYVDIHYAGQRFIVEVSLAREFEIARPTSQYTSLLDALPLIYVGKADELKQIVKLMCNAMNESMKTMELHLPPWRRKGYMQAKWFNSYRRTTNDTSTTRTAKSSVGVVSSTNANKLQLCRDQHREIGIKISYLTTVLDSKCIRMQS